MDLGFTALEHLEFSQTWNRTGWHPYADQLKSGFRGYASKESGPLDAPDFIAVGAAQCLVSVDVYNRIVEAPTVCF